LGSPTTYDHPINDPRTNVKLKALLRKMKARTYDDLWKAVGKVCDLFTSQECWN
jgi:hypothetical protein